MGLKEHDEVRVEGDHSLFLFFGERSFTDRYF